MKFINPQALSRALASLVRMCATARAFGFINFIDSTLCPYNYYLVILVCVLVEPMYVVLRLYICACLVNDGGQ